MRTIFRGRKTELKVLDRRFKQDEFVMTVLYGRHRIGKIIFQENFMSIKVSGI